MGAYENPALIRDNSGKYIYQGLADFGKGIAAGVTAYSANVANAHKLAAQIEKERQQRNDRINLAGINALNDWSKNLRDQIPKNSEAIVYENIEKFITENSDGYLESWKNQALATNPEERSIATAKINDFNKKAGMQTQGAANLNEHLTNYKTATGSSDYVFFDPQYQVGMKMVDTGLPISGFDNLNISSKLNEQGETILNVQADITDAEVLKDYGLENLEGPFNFELNLNRSKTESYVGQKLPGMDKEGIGKTTGILNSEGGQINEAGIVKVLNSSNREITYYKKSSPFVNSVTQEANVLSKSYFGNTMEDKAQLRATLIGMNYPKEVIDKAIEMGHVPTEARATIQENGEYVMEGEGSVADLIRDYNLRINNTEQGLATEETIANIKEYNATVDPEQQMEVPQLGDVYLYSAAPEIETKSTSDQRTQPQITLDEAAKTYAAYKTTEAATPQDYIKILMEQTNTEGAMPRTIDSAAREMALTKDKDGFPEYPSIHNAYVGEKGDGTNVQAAMDALLAMRDDYNENTIFILSSSGAVKNVIDFSNQNQKDNYYLQKLGFKPDKVQRIQRQYFEQYKD
jgi:hypothetical protein